MFVHELHAIVLFNLALNVVISRQSLLPWSWAPKLFSGSKVEKVTVTNSSGLMDKQAINISQLTDPEIPSAKQIIERKLI